MYRYFAIVIVTIVVTMSPVASARSIFLNGVDITTVRDQTFKGATIRIDRNGDIRITAPGYKVELVDPKGGTNSSLADRFYLVTKPSREGRAQYDFVITVNGVEQKIIKAGSSQIIMEISAWLHRGENEVIIAARKNIFGGRKSSSPGDETQILLGTGHEEGKTVKIDSVRAKVKVNASSLSNKAKHFVLIVK